MCSAWKNPALHADLIWEKNQLHFEHEIKSNGTKSYKFKFFMIAHSLQKPLYQRCQICGPQTGCVMHWPHPPVLAKVQKLWYVTWQHIVMSLTPLPYLMHFSYSICIKHYLENSTAPVLGSLVTLTAWYAMVTKIWAYWQLLCYSVSIPYLKRDSENIYWWRNLPYLGNIYI